MHHPAFSGRWIVCLICAMLCILFDAAPSTAQTPSQFTMREVLHIDTPTAINTVAWTPDGAWVATGHGAWYGDDEPLIRLWDGTTGAAITECAGSDGPVMSLSWHPDGTQLASVGGSLGGQDNHIWLWDVTADSCTLRETYVKPMVITLKTVAWRPDGRWLVSDQSDRMHDMISGEVYIVPRHAFQSGIAWHPASTHLASAIWIDNANMVAIWNAATLGLVTTFGADPAQIQFLAWSPDGTRIATVYGSIYDNDGEYPEVRIWDVATGALVGVLEGHTHGVIAVAWSPDGTLLATASADHTVRIWDATTYTTLHVMDAHTEWVIGVDWHPDSTYLASAGYDGTVRIWEPVEP